MFKGWFAGDPDPSSLIGADTVQNINEFKRNPGSGGQGRHKLSLEPATGLTVRLLNPSLVSVGSGITDQDDLAWAIVLKANAYQESHFDVP